jgi:hypothetical protein
MGVRTRAAEAIAMTGTLTCRHCGGRGARMIAAISDPHWTQHEDGGLTVATSFAIPIIVPCLCVAERAARLMPDD